MFSLSSPAAFPVPGLTTRDAVDNAMCQARITAEMMAAGYVLLPCLVRRDRPPAQAPDFYAFQEDFEAFEYKKFASTGVGAFLDGLARNSGRPSNPYLA